MMLKPSIDTLLDKVPSKYSLVILEAKRAHELEAGAPATQEFKSEKSTLRALEEIESGNVTIHPDPEGKREAVRLRIEEEKRRKEEEEKKIKEQIAKEKKMVKNLRLGGLNLIFLLQEFTDKKEVRRWL
ncbi:DNA-directed RNA polymerase, omega subunit [Streptococcus oralis SK313]|uniref:DNA-directed RNA polymerase subunit omega n=1 Tax=Streptococcus oralis SK313 TaxID=1035190 RepID=F9Q2S6_STROR|nr:DNA-directed RNA polymerase, omega subunit [Streptococcus oralis SK313]